MDNYLYVLLFDNNTHFKIGISKKNNNRLKQHDRTYGVNQEKSYIFESKCNTHISTLEKLLLCLYPETKDVKYDNLDGHTEIRDVAYYDDCIQQMDNYQKTFLLKKTKLTDLTSKHTPKLRKQETSDVIIKTDVLNFDLMLCGYTHSKSIEGEFVRYKIAYGLCLSYFDIYIRAIVYFNKTKSTTNIILRLKTIE